MATAVAEPQPRVLDIVKKVTTIATLPEVTAKIIATVEDPKSTAAKLHQIVSHDPALVTRILKVVNSAFYGLPGQIGSIERAIVLLGLNAVKNIAVAASIGQLFRTGKLCEGFAARRSVDPLHRRRRQCPRSGQADEAPAGRRGVPRRHDSRRRHSRSVADQPRAVASRLRSRQNSEADFCDLERQIIGVDHQQLGATLAELWKFPHSCQMVAGHHHQPLLMSDTNRMLVNLVHVADVLCCKSKHGFNLTAVRQTLNATDLATMKIDPAAVDRTTAALDELVANASSVFG